MNHTPALRSIPETCWRILITALGLISLFPISNLHAQTQIGDDDVRLSHAGPDGDVSYDASHEGIAYDSARDRYLVVWDADARLSGSALDSDGKFEIFGRMIGGDGTSLGDEQLLASLGPENNTRFDAENPEVVYNSVRDEYLIVFVGTVAISPTGAKREIFVRRIDSGGRPLADPQRISTTGPDSDVRLDSREPALAFNSQADEYLIVWQREEQDSGSGAENEIYGQRLSGEDGSGLAPASRISQMGPDGNTSFDASDPALTYHPGRNEYFVVWRGDDNRPSLVNGEFEIFGQRLSAAGQQTGVDDLRISHMGPNRDPGFDAEDPFVVVNPDRDEYLVTWTATDDRRVGDEVYAKLLTGDGSSLREQFQLSSAGPDGDPSYAVDETEAVYNPLQNEYFVVWMATDESSPGVSRNGREVYGQRLSAVTGDEIGLDDVAISTMGPPGSSRYDVYSIDLAHNSNRDEYLVAWSGDDNRGALVDDELEIFYQRLTPEVPPCVTTESALCLAGGRFRVTVDWATRDGNTGSGRTFTLTGDTGGFWFFDPANVELVVKVLDGRAINDRFWVFFGALSDVEYRMSVRDTSTGEEKVYRNSQGSLASVGDTAALPLSDRGARLNPLASSFDLISEAIAIPQRKSVSAGHQSQGKATCVVDDQTHCLSGGRFAVTVEWTAGAFGGSLTSGPGRAVRLTEDSGLFWFFDSENIELIIKVLDGRGLNGAFWVYFGALSNVEYTVRVVDTETGETRTYNNPAGNFASVADTEAFR